MRIENLRTDQFSDRRRVVVDVSWEDCGRTTQEVYFETIAPFAEDLAPSIDAFLKCVRTRLALVALGKLDRATSFPLGELTPGMLAVVELTPRNAPFYQECLAPLERLGRHDHVAPLLPLLTPFHRRHRANRHVVRVKPSR